MNLSFHCSTEIRFSREGASGLAAELARSFTEIIVVTGRRSARSTGRLPGLTTALDSASLKVRVVEGVEPNPTDGNIEALRPAFEDDFGQAIVSLGGGSVHDAARLLNLLSSQAISLEEATVEKKGFTRIAPPRRRLVTIPTISGTGAEVSPAALVRLGDEKRIVFSRELFPKLAYVDPYFLHCEDPALIAAVGLDAFFQGLEAYVSAGASEWSDPLALSAVALAARHLPRLVENPEDSEAAMKVAVASIQGLLAVTTAGVGGIHALSDALSGVFGAGHGIALAAVAPAVIAFNEVVAAQRYSTIADMLEPNGDRDTASRLSAALARFIDRLGATTPVARERSRVMLIPREEFIQLSLNPDMATNPREMTADDIGQAWDMLAKAS